MRTAHPVLRFHRPLLRPAYPEVTLPLFFTACHREPSPWRVTPQLVRIPYQSDHCGVDVVVWCMVGDSDVVVWCVVGDSVKREEGGVSDGSCGVRTSCGRARERGEGKQIDRVRRLGEDE